MRLLHRLSVTTVIALALLKNDPNIPLPSLIPQVFVIGFSDIRNA